MGEYFMGYPMSRPTRERLEQIREARNGIQSYDDLFAEIDALEADKMHLQSLTQEWEFLYEHAEKDIDAMTAEFDAREPLLVKEFERYKQKLDIADEVLAEFADYTNPIELKSMAWPYSNYVGKARDALAKMHLCEDVEDEK